MNIKKLTEVITKITDTLNKSELNTGEKIGLLEITKMELYMQGKSPKIRKK